MVRRALLLAVLLGVSAVSAAAETIYTYTGNAYGSVPDTGEIPYPPNVNGAYTADMFISGWLLFEDDIILPNEWGLLSLTPLAYSFSDGLQTLTQDNSSMQFDVGDKYLFAEGGSWVIDIRSDAD